ncbi:FGGY family of carbohydrate kinase, N-terminal domain protein [Mycobacterium kansasii 824]|uniref:FGGY family of carbohydrate kinase, N-terminal domain protein n=1 Tax=Mycobacterium kansasii TaxID=1768 RepID=A0A1V3WLQ2_MYCKA|nr:FGGY family of carbohydrate kinase, N-terminal domain protein [Mycobacterium kansasii 824]OOK67772.1 FGGY family of carbohydrate kinase, N-terminal domain protein [Mycobacterium kansasii]
MAPVSREAVTMGIDIGSTAVKAVVADENGNVKARVRIPHQLRVPAPDRLEHDADEAWRRGRWRPWTGWPLPLRKRWPFRRWCPR